MRNLPDVLGRRPEPVAELLRRQPAMKVRRVWIVLPRDELLQLLFFRAAAPQHHKDMFLGQAVGSAAAVKLGSCGPADVPVQTSQAILIHLNRSKTLSRGGCRCNNHQRTGQPKYLVFLIFPIFL